MGVGCLPLTGYDNSLTHAIAIHGGIGILCDGEKMGLEFTSPPSTVGLDDLWAIEGDPLERIHGDEDNAGIGVDTMLSITIPDGVKDWRERLCEWEMWNKMRMMIPDGSLRWERVARSSAVSRRGGLRKGGRSSLPSFMAWTEVLIVISWIAGGFI